MLSLLVNFIVFLFILVSCHSFFHRPINPISKSVIPLFTNEIRALFYQRAHYQKCIRKFDCELFRQFAASGDIPSLLDDEYNKNNDDQSSENDTINDTYKKTRTKSRYIPPELDPEYRSSPFKSKTVPTVVLPQIKKLSESSEIDDQSREEDFYPVPRTGDIIQYEGKWGEGELELGRIRFLKYLEDYESYFADVVPLKEGKSENVFVLNRDAAAQYLNLQNVRPVKSFFVRSENGYKVYRNKNNGDIVLKAPCYRKVDASYDPREKPVDFSKLESGLQSYEVLKERIVLSSLQLGLVVTVFTAYFKDVETAGIYAAGVLAGALYLYLLGVKVDSIGSKYSLAGELKDNNITTTESDSVASTLSTTAEQSRVRFLNILSNARLLIPLVVIGIIAKTDSFAPNVMKTTDFSPSKLSLIPQSQYIPLMAGFVTNRFSIFINEVGNIFLFCLFVCVFVCLFFTL